MRSSLLVVLALAALPASAGKRVVRPEPEALLRAAAAEPSAPYEARVRVQVFPPAGKPKGLTRVELRAPGGRRRVEVRRGRKTSAPSLLWVSDGTRETVSWTKEKRAWTGPARKGAAPDASGFELSVSTGGRVAKRPTWTLEFRDKAGALRRRQWTDRETGLLLKREDYAADGRLERRVRVMKLGPIEGEADFDPAPPAGYAVDASPEGLAAAAALLETPR